MGSKKQAEIQGKRILKLISNPKGWGINIWENCGWHVSLNKQGLSLRGYTQLGGVTIYSCMLSAEEDSSGETYWSTDDDFRTPDEAIDNQIKVAKKFVNELKIVIKKIEA